MTMSIDQVVRTLSDRGLPINRVALALRENDTEVHTLYGDFAIINPSVDLYLCRIFIDSSTLESLAGDYQLKTKKNMMDMFEAYRRMAYSIFDRVEQEITRRVGLAEQRRRPEPPIPAFTVIDEDDGEI